MRTISIAAVVLFASSAAWAHAPDGIVQRTQSVAAFSEVELAGGLEVVVSKGEPKVVLEGEAADLDHLKVEVAHGRLTIAPQKDTWRSRRQVVKVSVTVPELKRVEASGGVGLRLEGGLAPRLALDLSGGVETTATSLSLDSLDVDASGGVELHLAGSVKSVDYDLSGGVTLDAKGLKADTVRVDASGGCEVDVAARQEITGSASGGVDVTVHGRPASQRVHTSGGASVAQAD